MQEFLARLKQGRNKDTQYTAVAIEGAKLLRDFRKTDHFDAMYAATRAHNRIEGGRLPEISTIYCAIYDAIPVANGRRRPPILDPLRRFREALIDTLIVINPDDEDLQYNAIGQRAVEGLRLLSREAVKPGTPVKLTEIGRDSREISGREARTRLENAALQLKRLLDNPKVKTYLEEKQENDRTAARLTGQIGHP